jgi:hypothetical protein
MHTGGSGEISYNIGPFPHNIFNNLVNKDNNKTQNKGFPCNFVRKALTPQGFWQNSEPFPGFSTCVLL